MEHRGANVEVGVAEVEQKIVIDAHQVVGHSIDVLIIAVIESAVHEECIVVLF